MHKGILASTLSAAFLVGCAGMNGAATSTACEGSYDVQDGYAGSSAGKIIKSGTGGIVHTGNWSEDNIFAACEGGEDKAAMEAEAAAAAEAERMAQEKAEAEAEAAAAAAAAAADANSDTPKVEVNVPTKLDARALFPSGGETLSTSGKTAIDQLASGIAELTEVNRVVVVGHSDSQGAEAYNQGLSERRAQAVRDQLASQLPDLDIAAIGRGESRPIASNDTALGRAKNRRVEVVVIGTKTEMK